MTTRKIAAAALSLVLLAGTAGAVGTGTQPIISLAAEEETVFTELDADAASLFLPQSYEQYLPLQTPSHATFSENRIAVADGATLYLYNRASGEYSYYEHKTGADQKDTVLSELQFDRDGTLYFTDASMDFYKYDAEKNTASRFVGISCLSFYIADDYIYYATATGTETVSFFYVPLSSPNTESRLPIASFTGAKPHLAYEDGVLHCILNENIRTSYDVTGLTAQPSAPPKVVDQNKFLDNSVSQIAGLRYICAYRGALYYTVSGQQTGSGLYRTDENGNSTLVLESNDLSTLTVYDGKLYCVKGASVMEIAIDDENAAFTGYEIAAASSSPNRLSNAGNTVRAGNLLVSADTGNNRVSIYDLTLKEFTSHAVKNAEIVATDGQTIAATDGETVTVFTHGKEGETTYNIGETMGRIKGLACFFSTVYYVTENNAYGVVGGERVFYSGLGVPEGIACDLYGKIYVSYHDGGVYSFEESYFETRGTPVRVDVALPENYTSFRCDFEGNLYCLANGALYQNGKPFASFTQEPFVYGGTNVPLSCAVGFEDDRVYFCFGDYLVTSNAGTLKIPTLDKIALEGAKEQIFSTGDAQNLLVDVKENAVGINVDLSQMKEAEEHFPYAGYSRVNAVRGVRIAQTSDYSLVLVEKDRKYETLLFRTENTATVATEEYYKKSEENAYLSNKINACYHPCMENELAQNRLERGTFVKKLAEITLPERVYALVSYETETGAVLAYLPLSYLSDVPPYGYEASGYSISYLKAGETKFYSARGEELTVTERTRVRLYRSDDGTYTAVLEKDGETFTANGILQNQIDTGSNDALRISLIVILSVLAVLIVGVYIYLLPLRRKNG